MDLQIRMFRTLIVCSPRKLLVPAVINVQAVPLAAPLVQGDVVFAVIERTASRAHIDYLDDDALMLLSACIGGPIFSEAGDAVADIAFYVRARRMRSVGEGLMFADIAGVSVSLGN